MHWSQSTVYTWQCKWYKWSFVLPCWSSVPWHMPSLHWWKRAHMHCVHRVTYTHNNLQVVTNRPHVLKWYCLLVRIKYVVLQVATALLVEGSTLNFWIPLQTSFASTISYSSVVQSARLGCSYNCMRLTCGSFQLMHVTWWPHCWIDRAMAAKTKTKRYYSAHNVATRVSFDT